MFRKAMGIEPFLNHARCGQADLVLGLQRDALRLQRTMIDLGARGFWSVVRPSAASRSDSAFA
ncbi:MAG: hypothetical protein WCE20_07930 [Rhizomicrobium sp.]